MTHKELVEVAYRWVLKNAQCGIAFRELVTLNGSGEIPDVIGFGLGGSHSVMIECKASRGDFLSDKKKNFRKIPEIGMGKQRFYCCPTGLIKQTEIPSGWGLIYVNDKHKAVCVVNPYKGSYKERFHGFTRRNIRAEQAMMYSALRRLQLRGRMVEIYQSYESFLQNNNGN